MLGQDQDMMGGGTEASQSFHGYLSDLQILHRALSEAEMRNYVSCATQNIDAQTLVDFSDLQESFDFGEVTEVIDLGYEDACSRIDLYAPLFPEPRNLLSGDRFCKSIGGSLILPRTSLENDMITDVGKKYCTISRIWLGTEYLLGSTFMEYGTNHSLNYTDWIRKFVLDTVTYGLLYTKNEIGEPNWGITTPDRKLCTACGSYKPFSLQVRGLCADSKFDRQFLIYGYSSQKPSFVGLKVSNITWVAYNLTRDVFSGYWRMVVSAEPHIQAEMIMETR